ncbi:Putative signal transducing protein [Geosporobacter subterraneus DSM 17957]|uniref:Putative signal transducing protein n=1 Tax=Geosporobacter subterraneus DSM 17957 TaxID=1121919 RepID=A0A1M6LE92_9FIRM|nr:DUF2007 domain-containing protein [Geosporobacter subterraneus]SHJ69541.1 Putative signal transducing protein [Geosporobacter subterraneus DSM 17957]
MPWCPKCSTEYRNGYEKCHDCKVSLVQDEPIIKKESTPTRNGNWVLLTTAHGVEASLMVSLLSDNNIPPFTKQRGIDSYLQIVTGVSNNVEIYVREGDLCRAQELIEVMLNPIEPEI